MKAIFISGFIFCMMGFVVQDKANHDIWSKPAFSADAEALRAAAAGINVAKDAEVTVLLQDLSLSFDAAGRMLKKRHLIYRIETRDGVEGWSEVRGEWDPWYQAKPEIQAKVITADGAVHSLDPKTLNEVPVHDNSPDVYTDRKAYGGPLPALAVGAIVEEEVVTRDTSPFFSGGFSDRHILAWSVPVNKTRVVISHPVSLPVHYVLQQLQDATITKDTSTGEERITIEKGPMEAHADVPAHAPPDAVLYPELEISTGVSWQQVAAEYGRQVNDKLRLSDVQPVIAKLDLGKLSGPERINRIVAALHKNVRYTGVEFGESSLVPQFPGETLKRKYGDCKDKATLLIALLRVSGFPADLALLSAGPGQDINPELPGMGGFNHAIVHVPGTSSNSELWIDATDEYARAGDLPSMDHDRWALIANEKTTGLIKTPELTSAKNLHIESRQFTLADYGPAQIVERDDQFGPIEGEYRDYYSDETKKVRESSEKYVKDEYLADSLTAINKTDPADLAKPFVVTFTAKGRRGFTYMDNASVYIPHGNIFDGLPDYFYTQEKDEKKDPAEGAPKPRIVDWVIKPFTTEWRYKIIAPPGFKVRALPPAKEEQLGTAHFSQKYSSSQDGAVVEAVLRFETGKARITVDQARTLRDAIVKERNGEGISINFDQTGYALLSAGKIKDALAVDRQLVSTHPKDALQRVRLARVLLGAGLAEKARNVSKEAVALDPNSAQVLYQQGWILEHDLIGRRFGKGFDYAGAVACYRKAKQLDPKNKEVRAELGILLEYDDEGVRYSKKARLEDAITEFKELKKLDEDYARTYEDFVPYDLWHLGKFKEALDYVATLPITDTRRALTLAGIAATESAEAAIKRSLEITSDEQARNKALISASRLLLSVRRYSEAGDLLLSGARGQSNETQSVSYAALLKKTHRFDEIGIDESSPTSPFHKLLRLLYSAQANGQKLKELSSQSALKTMDPDKAGEEMERAGFGLRMLAEKSGVPIEAMADIALSNAHYSTEGNDALGYRVTIETPGTASQTAFIVREDGQYKIVEFSNSSRSIPENLGFEVLARLQRNDLPSARKWLDWARERIHINGGDDPLSGQPFPHFWTKGQEGDEAAIRKAALVLLPSKSLKDENMAALVAARDEAKADETRRDINLVLAYSYREHQQWKELRQVSEELLKAAPDSFIAFQFAAAADTGLGQLDDWEQLLQARLQKYPDEPDYLRSAAQLASYRGQFAKAGQLLKGLIDKGTASAEDMNLYGWYALYASGPISQDAIDVAHRASELTKNSSFHILHTVACLYAASGKGKEARQFLLKAMDANEMQEPDSSVWLGLAMIAEGYGEMDSARAMYARVEKQDPENPTSNYVLAHQHLVALGAGTVSAKAGAQ